LDEISDMAPGTLKGLHLVVNNIAQAREELISRGVHISGIIDVGGGVKYPGSPTPTETA